MSGTLPPEWGSPTAFQQLRYLYVVDCPLTGEPPVVPLPLFHKKHFLSRSACQLCASGLVSLVVPASWRTSAIALLMQL